MNNVHDDIGDGEWEPLDLIDEPTVNAVLNVAASIHELARAVNGLLYGMKFSKTSGTSIAEAIENVGESLKVAGHGDAVANSIDNMHFPNVERIAGALEKIAFHMAKRDGGSLP